MMVNLENRILQVLPFIPRTISWSGSEVPILRSIQQFYQRIFDNLEIIKYWNININLIEDNIKDVKIRELIEDL